MTEEEHEFITDLKNRFWHEFSDLCNKYIKEARDKHPEIADHAVMMLGESTSIYGRRQRDRS